MTPLEQEALVELAAMSAVLRIVAVLEVHETTTRLDYLDSTTSEIKTKDEIAADMSAAVKHTKKAVAEKASLAISRAIAEVMAETGIDTATAETAIHKAAIEVEDKAAEAESVAKAAVEAAQITLDASEHTLFFAIGTIRSAEAVHDVIDELRNYK